MSSNRSSTSNTRARAKQQDDILHDTSKSNGSSVALSENERRAASVTSYSGKTAEETEKERLKYEWEKALVHDVIVRYQQKVEEDSRRLQAIESKKQAMAGTGGSDLKLKDVKDASQQPIPQDRRNKRRVVETPQEQDVLFGRRKSNKNHPGNCILRRMCDSKRSVYDLADRDEKTEITRSIVQQIKSNGGCFLKFNEDVQMWQEVTDEVARQKVGHMVRNGRPQPIGRLEPEMFPPMQR